MGTPGELVVAGLQMDLAWEDPEENLARAERLVAEAVRAGADLVVLPEMFGTGFSMRGEAMARHGDLIAQGLSDLARRHQVWMLGGFAEPGDPRPFNAAALVDPEGQRRLHYRKIHPFTLAGEHEHFTGGEQIDTITINGVRVTPLICYDLRFPEAFRAVGADTDLFVVIANWPEARRGAWSTLLKARAIECQAYVLGVNRVGIGGREGGRTLRYSGDSALHGPLGETLASAEASDLEAQSVILSGRVRAREVALCRSRFSFLADRRPEIYRQVESARAQKNEPEG